MSRMIKKTISVFLSLIMVMSLLVVAPSVTAQAAEYGSFTLYYYYEGTEDLYMDIWNHEGIKFSESAKTSSDWGWEHEQAIFQPVEGNENWYSTEIEIIASANDGFTIYAGGSDGKLVQYDNQWNNTDDYKTLISGDSSQYAIKEDTIYTNLEDAGINLPVESDTFTLYYYYEGTEDLYMDIWNHEGIEFSESANTSSDWGWEHEQAIFQPVEGNENWYSTEIEIIASANDGFTIYAGGSDGKLVQYDNQWNNTDDYKTLISGDSSAYALYDNTLYTSLNAAKEALAESTIVRDAEITVNKVKDLSDDFMLGTDISAVHSIYASGASYYDEEEKPLTEAEFFKLLASNGVNWVRIRVWNDPYSSTETHENGDPCGYGGGNNDLETAIAMGKLATDAGMKVLIDFHYSDFWADPSKQKVPKAWSDYTLEQKENAVYTFTKDALNQLKDAKVNVGMVQVGNETNTGICGETDWTNMAAIFNSGSNAIREVDESILVALHFTNPEKGYSTIAEKLHENEVDYDVFASSYYPSWHGDLDTLKKELKAISDTYSKKVMVAETSYAWTLDEGDGHENTVRKGTNDTGNAMIYPFSVNGQAKWVRDVVDTVNSITDGIGVFYWEAAWIPVENITKAKTEDEREEIIASNKIQWEASGSGWASSYASEYDPEDAGKYYGGSAIDNQAFFDFDGKVLPSLKVYKYLKTGSVATNVEVQEIAEENVNIFYVDDVDELKNAVEEKMPKTVNVVLTDASIQTAEVQWEEKDLAEATKIGEYQISGKTTFEGNEFETSCILNINPSNYLTNYGFETGETDPWTVEGEGGSITGEDPHDGDKCFHFWKADAGTLKVEQKVTLEPGIYAFTGWFQGKDVNESYIYATVDGSEEQYRDDFVFSGWKIWQTPKIDSIVVLKESEVTVGYYINYKAEGWGSCDDFYLYKLDADAHAAFIDETIEAIGEVTQDSDADIEIARTYYDCFSEDEEIKGLVNNLPLLEAAEAAIPVAKEIAAIDTTEGINEEIEQKIAKARADYDLLTGDAQEIIAKSLLQLLEEAEQLVAQLDVEKLIDTIDNVTLDSKASIEAARAAYDELVEKYPNAKVENLKTLEDAEKLLAALEKDAADMEAAAAVDEKIAAIGPVTLDSKQAIETARAAYKALSDDAKAKVELEGDLKDAEDALAALIQDVEDAKAAAEVDEKIAAIGTVTLDSKDAIEAAIEAFEALSDTAKDKVKNAEILKAADEKYAELADAFEQAEAAAKAAKAAAAKVDELITAIGEVSIDKEAQITAARQAYSKLSDTEKKLVKGLATLEAAEKKLDELKAAAKAEADAKAKAEAEAKAAEQKIIDAAKRADMYINAIGTVTSLSSEATVEAARKVYDALSPEAKAKVTKLSDLEAAEKKIAELKIPVPVEQGTEITGSDAKEETVFKVTSDDKANPTVEYEGTKDSTEKTITIPATVTDANGITYTVTKIADDALNGNSKVTSVTIGENIVEIGKNAFKNCTKLKKITVKSTGITTIGEAAFSGDKALTSVDLSKSEVTEIGKNAFSGCTKLKTIKINGNKVTKIGKNAFKNLKKNATITIYAKNKTTYNKIVKLIKKSGVKNVKFAYKKKK